MDQLNRPLLRRFLAVARPYWVSNAKWKALGLLGILLFFLCAVNGLNIVINFVGGKFMTALSTKDAPTFYHMLKIYAAVFIIGTPIVVIYAWVRDKLALHWRNWLTNHLLEKYFQNRAYYRINNDAKIDNPDERIAQDISAFTKASLAFMLVILDSIITLVSFIAILWNISQPLVWTLVVYSTVGTVATMWVGKRLIGLNFNQLKLEADFRYNLIHVRNNTESIAFYQGEAQESSSIARRFKGALTNLNMLIGWQRNLAFMTTGYNYLVVIIPSLVIAPLYFAGKVEFGTITQADMAFTQVLAALSLVIAQFRDLSAFIAEINRLGSFAEALDAPDTSEQPGHTAIESREDTHIALENVTLKTPNYARTLVQGLSLEVASGKGLVIVGPSGSGKSSLLRAIAGLWKSGTGTIVRPSLSEMMFLPQRPYMILGSLRSQLLYPHNDTSISDEQLYAALAEVNLADLPSRVGGLDVELQWADVLSLGEQQRLAFARLLLAHPAYAILDESTSALDIKNEAHLYSVLSASGTTFISVGHRTTLLQYHTSVLELKGEGDWRVVPTHDYTPAFALAPSDPEAA